MISCALGSLGVLLVAQFLLVQCSGSERRYLLYSVDENEGFNLRRDVYIRVANLLRVLRDPVQYPLNDFNGSSLHKFDWILVLPPWIQTYHWKQQNPSTNHPQPWSKYFDVESLRLFIPVIEFDEFIQIVSMEKRNSELDVAFQVNQVAISERRRGIELKKPKVLPKYGRFSCGDQAMFNVGTSPNNQALVYFDTHTRGYSLKTSAIYCLHGALHAVELAGFLSRLIYQNPYIRTVYIGAAENLINGVWSEWSQQYWTVRRSMVFASHLTALGDSFRRTKLFSNDVSDRTTPPSSWLNQPWPQSPAIGGPYLGLHWRRGDFPRSTSLTLAVKQVLQIIEFSKELLEPLPNASFSHLPIFLATDANPEEIAEFKRLVTPHRVHRFTEEFSSKYILLPGEVAIIDQWICAHARFFLGTTASTFTFRITEEREIMGFPSLSTFNSLCEMGGPAILLKDGLQASSECEGLTPWTMVLEPHYTLRTSDAIQIKNEL